MRKNRNRKLAKQLRPFGLHLVTAKHSGHLHVRDAKGYFIASLPGTPSDYRSERNMHAVLRRLGFDARSAV